MDSNVTQLIGQRIARLAHIGDSGDLAEYAAIYADDATWEYSAGALRGVDAIIEQARSGRDAGRVGPGSGLRHVVTTVAVEAGEAGAESDAYILVVDTSVKPPQLRSLVTYHDVWRHDGTSWRLTARRIISG
jgi:hypothetical protein